MGFSFFLVLLFFCFFSVFFVVTRMGAAEGKTGADNRDQRSNNPRKKWRTESREKQAGATEQQPKAKEHQHEQRNNRKHCPGATGRPGATTGGNGEPQETRNKGKTGGGNRDCRGTSRINGNDEEINPKAKKPGTDGATEQKGATDQ